MVSMLVVVVVQNVSVSVDFKPCVEDKVDCVGERLSKMKFYPKVALFYKLEVISRTMIWSQIKCT